MRIVVYDMKGVIVSSKYINKTQLGVQRTLNIANLKSGTYFIAIIAQQSEKRMLKPFVKLP